MLININELYAGRFHPLLVHLPIGIYFIFILLYVYNTYRSKPVLALSYNFILLIAAIITTLTAITGYILAPLKGYDIHTVSNHRISGIALSIWAWIVWYLFYVSANSKIKSISLLLLSALIVITGHWGGSLTHGNNYLFYHTEQGQAIHENKSLDSVHYYKDIVLPILKTNCASCHHRPLSRAGWDMSTDSSLLAGGKYGSTIIKGDPENSELIKRISLPIESRKHMPPATMPALSPMEIFILKHWIKSGASTEKSIADAAIDEQTKAILAAYSGILIKQEQQIKLPSLPTLPDSVFSTLKNKIGIVNLYSPESNLLDVSLIHFRGKKKSEIVNALQLLIPYQEYIYVLDLAGLALESTDLKYIGDFKNLIKLNLSNNSIQDDGINYLDKLAQLESVNFFNNPVTDQSLEKLKKWSSLKNITLAETQITASGIQKWQEENKDIKLNY